MKNTWRVLLAALLLGCGLQPAYSQDDEFDKIMENMNAQFDQFKQNTEDMFNTFVENNDKIFSEHLRKAWEAFEIQAGTKPPSDPKPKDVPKIDPVVVKQKAKEQPKPIPVAPAPVVPPPPPAPRPKGPTIQKPEPDNFAKNNGQFTFYGSTVSFTYDKDFATSLAAVTPDAIANFWDQMTKTKHYHFINQMLDYKVNLNLNDWGYLQLLQGASKSITTNANAQELLTWFMLSKSRYKVKVGYSDSKVHLLLPSNHMIYGTPYYKMDGIKYFVMDKNAGNIRTYQSNYGDAKMLFDMSLNSPVNVGSATGTRSINYTYKGKSHAMTFKYNKSAMEFYNQYPLVNIKNYFDGAVSPLAKESMVNNLKPLIQGMNEIDAANLLINFVQTGFEYKTDPDQFGREKFFFAEELFHYPFSDCEDRSVLFSFLVRELLNLEVVGLGYPGHMATAVKFNSAVTGDYVDYQGKRFTICDPTYINAPIAMCMPQFTKTPADVIELDNLQSTKKSKDQIWATANKFGLYPGGRESNVVFDKEDNAYLTGFFIGSAQVGPFNLKANNDSAVDVFVAKFNAKGDVQWAKQATGAGSDIADAIALDADNNVLISGTFETTIDFEGYTYKAAPTGIFTAKYDRNGKLLWANQAEFDNAGAISDYIYVSSFNAKGEHLATILHDQTQHFSNYGFAFEDGNAIITGGFNSASTAGLDDTKYNSFAGFNLANVWTSEYEKLVDDNYDATIAGLFAFMKTLRISGSSVSGKNAQDALNTYNPNFKKTNREVYDNIGRIKMMSNRGGVITVYTAGAKGVDFSNLQIADQAKLKLTTYKGGNAQINILSGASVGKGMVRFDLNFIKLIKTTGDLILDYDEDHSQAKVNLKNDLLK